MQRQGVLCIVYVSEAAKEHVINQLLAVARNSPRCVVGHTFKDSKYNRTSFFLLGNSVHDVAEHALRLCSVAYELCDFSTHAGTHPALGSVDHICFSPLGNLNVSDVGKFARDFGRRLSANEGVPVFCYGGAAGDESIIRLRDIRKKLRYFDPPVSAVETARAGLYTGPNVVSRFALCDANLEADFGGSIVDICSKSHEIEDLSLKRDEGSILVSPSELVSSESSLASPPPPPLSASYSLEVLKRKGVACVGAVPFVLNFNMQFKATDPRTLVVKVASHVRCPEVEALTLVHEEDEAESDVSCAPRYEVACNLLRSQVVTKEEVLSKATLLATDLGLTIESSYTTGPTEEELLDIIDSINA